MLQSNNVLSLKEQRLVNHTSIKHKRSLREGEGEREVERGGGRRGREREGGERGGERGRGRNKAL